MEARGQKIGEKMAERETGARNAGAKKRLRDGEEKTSERENRRVCERARHSEREREMMEGGCLFPW